MPHLFLKPGDPARKEGGATRLDGGLAQAGQSGETYHISAVEGIK